MMPRSVYSRREIAALENIVALSRSDPNRFEFFSREDLTALSVWHFAGDRRGLNPYSLQDRDCATPHGSNGWTFRMPTKVVKYDVVEDAFMPPLPEDILKLLKARDYREVHRLATERAIDVRGMQLRTQGTVTTIS